MWREGSGGGGEEEGGLFNHNFLLGYLSNSAYYPALWCNVPFCIDMNFTDINFTVLVS